MTSKKDMTDHYRALELPRDCTQKEISASYKRLALLHHPDKTAGDKHVSSHFYQIQEAREVLRDPKRRLLYDQTLGLRSTFISRGYRKRCRPFGNPRSENPEQESDMPWNSKPPPEEYMYTWGSSVHMNLDSEWAQAEMARHAKEMDEWEMRYAGTDNGAQKAEYEHPRQFKEGQASPEGDAMVNEDGREHGPIDPEVQKSNEWLYAYGMKGGVPSDDEDSLPERATGEAANAWLGNDYDGDGVWKMKLKGYFYDAESETGSGFYSATDNASPLIDLSDNEQGNAATPNSSRENKAEPPDDFKPATDKEELTKDTEVPFVVAADEQESADPPTSSQGCFIDLSDDGQDCEAIPKSFTENKVGPTDDSKPAIDKENLAKNTDLSDVIAFNEQENVGSTTGSIGCFIDLSGDEQDYEASPNLPKENEIEPPDNSKKGPPKATKMCVAISTDEEVGTASKTGSIGCLIDLSDGEQNYEAFFKTSRGKPMSRGK